MASIGILQCKSYSRSILYTKIRSRIQQYLGAYQHQLDSNTYWCTQTYEQSLCGFWLSGFRIESRGKMQEALHEA